MSLNQYQPTGNLKSVSKKKAMWRIGGGGVSLQRNMAKGGVSNNEAAINNNQLRNIAALRAAGASMA